MKRPTLLTLAGSLGVLAIAGALLIHDDKPAPTTARTEVASAPAPRAMPTVTPAAPAIALKSTTAQSTVPTLDDVLAVDAPTDVLVTALADSDPIVVGESVNALVAREAHAAIPALLAIDVISRPRAAPSIIYALGRLATNAQPADREAAVDKLLALMAAEKKRGAQESQGNLLQIYEALGDTGDARAIAPLERELLDTTVPTAPKVVVVQALVALQARDSKGVLEQVAAQVAPSTVDTSFEAELRRDLVTVIQKALVQLS
jgi:hypothetical protein